MIKASELRVGNYVLIDTNDDRSGIRAITAISKYASGEGSISYNVGDYTTVGFFIRDVKPIPLTPEWLERFGFEKWAGEGWHRVKYFTSEDADDVHYLGVNCISGRVTFFTETEDGGDVVYCGLLVRYVHQLQNLYFALTGQELELKEKS